MGESGIRRGCARMCMRTGLRRCERGSLTNHPFRYDLFGVRHLGSTRLLSCWVGRKTSGPEHGFWLHSWIVKGLDVVKHFGACRGQRQIMTVMDAFRRNPAKETSDRCVVAAVADLFH